MDRIPKKWLLEPEVKTRTELLQTRKNSILPHLSYDIDGDGVVSQKDYFIAKRFDLDCDGKLSSEELQNAQRAIKEGFDSQFVWGCDSSGTNRSSRILQKRGVAILQEDYTPIQNTYPVIPHINKTPKQAKEEPKAINSQYKSHVQMLYPKRDNEVEPLVYVEKPRYPSCSYMRGKRKEQMLKDLESSANFSHKPDYQRLEQRERAFFIEKEPGKTYEQVRKRQRSLDFEHNSQIFKDRPIGVHGHKLPQFQDNMKEYWNPDGVSERKSRRNLMQHRKLGGKPESLVLNDGTLSQSEEAIYSYKSHKVYKKDPYQIAEKPNNIVQKYSRPSFYTPRKNYFREILTIIPKEEQQKQEIIKSPILFRTKLLKLNMVQRLSRKKYQSAERIRTTGFYEN